MPVRVVAVVVLAMLELEKVGCIVQTEGGCLLDGHSKDWT